MEHPKYNIKKEGKLDWSRVAQDLLSKAHYQRKDRGNDRSDGKKRKKI
jgi:hypothetical protein